MSGKGGKPRRNPGIKGVRPDRKAVKRVEAIARGYYQLRSNSRACFDDSCNLGVDDTDVFPVEASREA